MELLFSEELGLVLEVSESQVETVCQKYSDAGVQCHRIGRTCGFGPEATVRQQHPHLHSLSTLVASSHSISLAFFQVTVCVDGQEVLREPLPKLRALWEDTSFQLERLQANELCVNQEEEGLARRTQPYFRLTFDPCETPSIKQLSKTNYKQHLHIYIHLQFIKEFICHSSVSQLQDSLVWLWSEKRAVMETERCLCLCTWRALR